MWELPILNPSLFLRRRLYTGVRILCELLLRVFAVWDKRVHETALLLPLILRLREKCPRDLVFLQIGTRTGIIVFLPDSFVPPCGVVCF